ncbi:MAG TPA: hypothetical protein VGU23_07345, partial [Acidobacteriaceae bacterium]|nr:hypothetical protein [Acidobacteriaceae bacterium]
MANETMNRRDFLRNATAVAVSTRALSAYAQAQQNDGPAASESRWNVALKKRDVLALTGWFTAQDVDAFLATASGLEDAVNWCKRHGATKVHLEAFGRGLYANRKTLLDAKERFLKDGFIVQSGITTQRLGKQGCTDQRFITSPCYTVKSTQDDLQKAFEYVASLFDTIIIDDLYFMDCQCAECIVARGDQAWSKYYCDLMDRLSQERVLKPARAINPKVKIIIKFPQWYDEFHERGYDVPRESKIFDGIWVGTESRNWDYDNSEGYETTYNPYFLMRWLSTFSTINGGWFDSERTTVPTFLEQARHTVLGGGNEMILWTYGEMIKETIGAGKTQGTPAANMDALTKELPALTTLAEILRDQPAKGIHLLKPGNSDPYEEKWVCSFLGSLGLPLLPAHEIDEQAKAAIFPVQALKDPDFPAALQRMLERETPVVITDGLAKRLTSHPVILASKSLTILKVAGSPKALLKMSRDEIKPFRDKLLAPMGIKFDAP